MDNKHFNINNLPIKDITYDMFLPNKKIQEYYKKGRRIMRKFKCSKTQIEYVKGSGKLPEEHFEEDIADEVDVMNYARYNKLVKHSSTMIRYSGNVITEVEGQYTTENPTSHLIIINRRHYSVIEDD